MIKAVKDLKAVLLDHEGNVSISGSDEDLNIIKECLRAIERALLISDSDPLDRTQEAAHYNWLDDQYEKLQAENDKLKSVLKDFITTKECKQTWIEEMHLTIEDILKEDSI